MKVSFQIKTAMRFTNNIKKIFNTNSITIKTIRQLLLKYHCVSTNYLPLRIQGQVGMDISERNKKRAELETSAGWINAT